MEEVFEGRAGYVGFEYFEENFVPLELLAYGYVQDISETQILIKHKPLDKEYESKDVIFIH